MPIAGRWKLAPSLASQWENLEQSLIIVASVLIETANQLFPLEFGFFPFPKSYGYLRTHRSEHFARKCAMRARDAFQPLMAMCSFMLSYQHGRVYPNGQEPTWVKAILDSNRVHPEWLQLFRDSPIADLSGRYPRVGVVVDISQGRCPYLFRWMVNAAVPVWFRWAPLQPGMKQSPLPELQIYFPTGEQVTNAYKDFSRQRLLAQIDTSYRQGSSRDHAPPTIADNPLEGTDVVLPSDGIANPSSGEMSDVSNPTKRILPEPLSDATAKPPFSDATAKPSFSDATTKPSSSQISDVPNPTQRKLPEPHSDSRQKHGETWQEFFQRQARRHEKMLASESSREKQARQAREISAENFLAPGKKGARVFLWNDVDGFLLRTRVNWGEVEDLWEDTPHQHM